MTRSAAGHHDAHHTHSYSKTVLGFWLFLMSDAMMFAALFATYAVLHNSTYGGPSAGDLFSLPVALSQTLILLASSVAAGPALLAAHRHEKGKVIFWFGLAFLLGVSFLTIEMCEFSRLLNGGNNWESNAFLSSYFNLVGTHTLHVIIGLMWMVFLMAKIISNGLTAVAIKRLTCLRLFWHFVNIIWVFIFTFVYLMGAK